MGVNQKLIAALQQKLDERKENGLFRSLVTPEHLVDFSSNDYLGFARHPLLQASAFPPNILAGATGSRLISGNTSLAEETEQLIANFHDAEAALIFNSGYDANLGLLSCIAGREDTIITDEWVHASIIDGVRLSHATRLKFLHNNTDDLTLKLERAKGNVFVVVESVYSMDGDEAPLAKIASICERFDAALIVDEAHATGIYGTKGEGIVSKEHLSEKVFARVITFGKALGLHGACVLGSHALRQYLINYARPFIYSTALPPQIYHQLQTAYQLLPNADRQSLMDLVTYFQTEAKKIKGIAFLQSNSPIQGILLHNNEQAKQLALRLGDKGFFIKAILSPTVPIGTERIRICIHLFNTKAQIAGLLEAIAHQ